MAARDLPSLNAVRVFETVAQELNFTRAADRLNVTQGAVSRQIRQLEDEIGVALFRREGRQLALTEAGRQYRDVVESSLAALRQGTARLRHSSGSPRLNLTVLPSFAGRWLIARLQDFQATNPELNIWLGTSYEPIDFERDLEVDAGIRFGRGRWPNVHIVPLVEEQVAPVCTPDLAAQLRDTWLDANGVKRAVYEPRLSNDFSVILRAAVEGQGVAMARDLLVADDLKAGRLVRPFPGSVPSQFNYFFVCSPRRAADPALIGFVDWLRAAMRATLAECWG